MVMVRCARALGWARGTRTRRSTSAGRNSIHWPRTLTSGAFSLASRSSSAWSICWSPSAASQSKAHDPSWLSRPAGARAPARGGRRRGLEPHAQAGPRGGPTTTAAARRTRPPPAPGAASTKKRWAPARVDVEPGGRGLAQRLPQLGVDPHGPAQFGQEDLLGRVERPAGALELGPARHTSSATDHQARGRRSPGGGTPTPTAPLRPVGPGRPRPSVGGPSSRPSPSSGGSRRRRQSRKDPPRGRGVGAPFTDELLHLGQLVAGRPPPRASGEARAASQDSRAAGTGSPPRRGSRMGAGRGGGQRVPAHRTDEGGRAWWTIPSGWDPLGGEGTADRRKRLGHGAHAPVVRPVQQGFPDRLGPLGAAAQVGQDPPGGHDLEGQGGQHGEGRQGGARVELRRPRRAQGQGDVEGRRRAQPEGVSPRTATARVRAGCSPWRIRCGSARGRRAGRGASRGARRCCAPRRRPPAHRAGRERRRARPPPGATRPP